MFSSCQGSKGMHKLIIIWQCLHHEQLWGLPVAALEQVVPGALHQIGQPRSFYQVLELLPHQPVMSA